MFEVRRLMSAFRGGLVALCIALTASCGGGGGGGATDTTPPPPTGGSSTTAPAAPSSLQASAGNAQVALTWSSSTGATSYNVKRSTTNGGPYTQLQSATSASYTDTGLTNGTTYYYVVSAVNSGGESANSTQASAMPAAPTSPPPAPTAVTATAGDAQVTVAWSASNGAVYYNVKRSITTGGPYTQLKSPTTLSYLDTGLTNGVTYFYVVTAVNSVGESGNSTEVSAIPVLTHSNPPPTTTGTWVNVTPMGVDLNNDLPCGNYGVESVQVDPADGHTLYAQFHCQGIWKSTDYGVTWTGPINTGTNGSGAAGVPNAGDCAGGITIPPHSTQGGPTIYESCIRGDGLGFWKSTDGGVSWTHYTVGLVASREDYYPPVVDPYDETHLIMAGHEMNYLVQSTDGGQTWTLLNMASGMMQNGGTGEVSFIDTGSASSTRGTWLWVAQFGAATTNGTWRTSNGGTAWTLVDQNTHPHGAGQIYQPDGNGSVFLAGLSSALGDGVLRSTDYGQTWMHVGNIAYQTVVLGTSKNVYSMYGWSAGAGQAVSPNFQIASQVGTGTWIKPGTPAGLTQGAHEIRAINDGTHNILVGAMGNVGLWRYVEP